MRVMPLRRVVVGIDGSRPSARALTWALELCHRCGGTVVAVHAVGLLAHLDGDRVVPAAEHRDELERAFARWTSELTVADVPHRSLLIDGEASTVLVDAAEREDADLVVVGTRGVGNAPADILGSTAHRVAQTCNRPVLLVPSTEGS